MLDLKNNSYLYAQALDNSGDTQFWSVNNLDGSWSLIRNNDIQIPQLQYALDLITTTGRCYAQSDNLSCYATFSGPALIKLSPATLDVDGRISPILLLFDIFSEHRGGTLASLPHQLTYMSRELSPSGREQFSNLFCYITKPRILVFLSLLFCRKAGTK